MRAVDMWTRLSDWISGVTSLLRIVPVVDRTETCLKSMCTEIFVMSAIIITRRLNDLILTFQACCTYICSATEK